MFLKFYFYSKGRVREVEVERDSLPASVSLPVRLQPEPRSRPRVSHRVHLKLLHQKGDQDLN